ncbi:hypothetical protein GA0115259_1032714, partial [Streptomyces sp. MnatMP-M17]
RPDRSAAERENPCLRPRKPTTPDCTRFCDEPLRRESDDPDVVIRTTRTKLHDLLAAAEEGRFDGLVRGPTAPAPTAPAPESPLRGESLPEAGVGGGGAERGAVEGP